MNATLRALNRFGLGARPGEAASITDARVWLRAQLNDDSPRLAAPAAAAPDDVADALRALRMAAQGDEQARRQARQRLIAVGVAEHRVVLTERVTSERPFVERLVAFWSNHLCVSASAKLLVTPLAGSYEREAIRPHVLGRFEDMVLASARHPAMLFYLDNFQSIGPNSRGARFGRRAGRERGLNENYARELLELHTLGVDGGYTQQDVVELARMLTGWTVAGIGPGAGGRRRPFQRAEDGPIRFAFQELLHEPDGKTLLGVRYQEDGAQEGERAIQALCRNPATARFIATKLVRHFVADEPPTTAVNRIAHVFTDSDGDLRTTAAALVDLPEAWTESTRKFRTPQDWLVAVLRAFRAHEVNDAIGPVLRQLRHPLWSPQSPKGFPDTTQEWADPDSLLNRAELARTIARRVVRSAMDPRPLLEVVDVAGSNPLHALLGDASISAEDRVALAIAGPAFQWR